jgi:hypothetical protein
MVVGRCGVGTVFDFALMIPAVPVGVGVAALDLYGGGGNAKKKIVGKFEFHVISPFFSILALFFGPSMVFGWAVE